jgi:hypothetical protein
MTIADPSLGTAFIAEELESMLDSLERPKDADVVGALITNGGAAPSRADEIAGIPGLASSFALSLVVEWFLSLLKAFLEDFRSKASSAAGDATVSWISSRFTQSKTRPYSVSDRAQTVAEIAATLEKKGWPRDLVEKTANELWDRSARVAARLKEA